MKMSHWPRGEGFLSGLLWVQQLIGSCFYFHWKQISIAVHHVCCFHQVSILCVLFLEHLTSALVNPVALVIGAQNPTSPLSSHWCLVYYSGMSIIRIVLPLLIHVYFTCTHCYAVPLVCYVYLGGVHERLRRSKLGVPIHLTASHSSVNFSFKCYLLHYVIVYLFFLKCC